MAYSKVEQHNYILVYPSRFVEGYIQTSGVLSCVECRMFTEVSNDFSAFLFNPKIVLIDWRELFYFSFGIILNSTSNSQA